MNIFTLLGEYYLVRLLKAVQIVWWYTYMFAS